MCPWCLATAVCFTRAPGSPFAVGRSPYPGALGGINGDGHLDIIATTTDRNNGHNPGIHRRRLRDRPSTDPQLNGVHIRVTPYLRLDRSMPTREAKERRSEQECDIRVLQETESEEIEPLTRFRKTFISGKGNLKQRTNHAVDAARKAEGCGVQEVSWVADSDLARELKNS